MGGGKTHNMLALALLAQNPSGEGKLLGKAYDDIAK
jgi:predicted AAA+ superfamily ATPase